MNLKSKLIASAMLCYCLFGTIHAFAQDKHYIDVWALGGYNALLHGIEGTKTPGSGGGAVGVGYEFNHNNFILTAGAEYMRLASTTRLSDYAGVDYNYDYPYIADYQIPYHYTFADYRERYSQNFLNVPIQFGWRFDRYYALAGARLGLSFASSYSTDATLRTTALDPSLIAPIEGLQLHGIGDKPITQRGALDFGFNTSVSLEAGIYLDEWLPRSMTQLNNRKRTRLSYRVGAFVDYGLLNLNQAVADRPLVDAPVGNDMWNVLINPLPESTLAQGKRFGNLFAGVKLAVLFDVTKKKSKRPSKQQPTTLPFCAWVVDAATNEGVQADVTVRYTSGNREVFSGSTDADGFISCGELRKGRYTVLASAEGYVNLRKSVPHFRLDTLLIPLKPVPSFIISVTDAETGSPVAAEVVLSNGTDHLEVLRLTTPSATGIASAKLGAGAYEMNVQAEGYIYQQATVNHTAGDTVLVSLQPVKKDVKVVLHNLFFALNSAEILPESGPALDDLFRFMSDNPEVHILITGHTDNTGSLDYNMKLSAERAGAVYTALVERGITPSRITYEGRGPNEPVATNDTEEGRAANRRVEFTIQ